MSDYDFGIVIEDSDSSTDHETDFTINKTLVSDNDSDITYFSNINLMRIEKEYEVSR